MVVRAAHRPGPGDRRPDAAPPRTGARRSKRPKSRSSKRSRDARPSRSRTFACANARGARPAKCKMFADMGADRSQARSGCKRDDRCGDRASSFRRAPPGRMSILPRSDRGRRTPRRQRGRRNAMWRYPSSPDRCAARCAFTRPPAGRAFTPGDMRVLRRVRAAAWRRRSPTRNCSNATATLRARFRMRRCPPRCRSCRLRLSRDVRGGENRSAGRRRLVRCVRVGRRTDRRLDRRRRRLRALGRRDHGRRAPGDSRRRVTCAPIRA